jgi:DNA-binding NtrC family response regulator
MLPPSDGTRQKILLIDDDDLIAGSLRGYLVMQGYDVDVALELPQAVALMTEHRYDLVLVDPYLTGSVHGNTSGILASVRALAPSAVVIVLTGYGSPELARAAETWKITAFLTKPQSVPFLSEYLAGVSRGMPAAEPSIKGQPE